MLNPYCWQSINACLLEELIKSDEPIVNNNTVFPTLHQAQEY